jgi:hypothetical protein
MTNNYYFKFDDLKALLEKYNNDNKLERTVAGFVFTPGIDEEGKEKIFAFTVFSDMSDADVFGPGNIDNQGLAGGCPFPPRC